MAREQSSRLKAPEVCPVCGEAVPTGAKACPECGADHNSGWRDGAGIYNGLDLPDEEFDYEQFVDEEFGSPVKPSGTKSIWWITAIVLVVALVVGHLLAMR